MKLLSKTTLYLITVSLFIFFIGGVGFYKVFTTIVDKHVNNELYNQMYQIIDRLNTEIKSTSDIILLSSDRISGKRIEDFKGFNYHYSDTILYDKYKKLYMPFRKLTFQTEIKGGYFEFSIHKSLFETNMLVKNIALITTILLLLFIACIYFLNKYFFKQIWADFFNTIERIEKYDIDASSEIELPESMIIEFNKLNKVLNKMIKRIHQDYTVLKDFTGNISHEIQTPLAIINSKTELLLQSEKLTSEQSELINDIYSGTNRLSKLNQTLILLTKIENHQFPEKEEIDVSEKIHFHISNFESLLDSKNIELIININEKAKIEINPELADVLIINLIKNAIRHNITGGTIFIELENKKLSIKNSGEPINIKPSEIFKRFTKSNKIKGSLGLGLSIVKKICDYYNFGIQYIYDNNMHVFEVRFKSI